jgi:hypothetical protein
MEVLLYGETHLRQSFQSSYVEMVLGFLPDRELMMMEIMQQW